MLKLWMNPLNSDGLNLIIADAEIDKLKAQVDEIQAARFVMREHNDLLRQLAECKKDSERWKDELFSVLVQDMTRPSALKRIEEIEAQKEEA